MPPPPTATIDTLTAHFRSTHHLHLRGPWLAHTLATQRLPTGAALLASLRFRVLASDITESLQARTGACLPAADDAADDAAAAVVPGPVAVQVVAVEDVGVSRVERLERLEMAARGEAVRGREVVRVLPEEAGGPGAPGRAGKKGPCKLLVEDAGGSRAYAVELEAVEGVRGDMAIGAKLVLKNVTAARGLLLLTPGNTTFLGGKIEALNLAWIEGRRQALQSEIEQLKSQGSGLA